MTRKEAIKTLQELWRETNDSWYEETYNMAIKALEQEPCDDMGEVSDGYHTFNQLYHQRAVLFATIVNQNKDKSWKSFRHSDGNYCFDSNGEWFIVGIDTPQGSYTYHYSKEYWNMFDCEELEFGKEWDGHTEEDVTRLLSLEQEPSEDCISRKWLEENAKEFGGYYEDTVYAVPLSILDNAPIRTKLANCDAAGGFCTSVNETICEGIHKALNRDVREKGKWIAIDDTHSQCMECGAIFCITSSNEWEVDYCPNCGSRMEVEEIDE